MASPNEYLYDLMRHKRWDDVKKRITTEEGKEELRRKDKYGRLPLHDAGCYDGAPFELVEAILQEYPEAAKVTDREGFLPLHLACDVGDADISLRVVQILLDAFPEGAKALNHVRQLPLHMACVRDSGAPPFELVEMLLRAYPEAAKVSDQGWIALHHACRDDISPRVMQLLLQAYPEGARSSTRDGDLPLHIALDYCVPSEVIRMLIDAYPEGAATCNNGGNVPLESLLCRIGDGVMVEHLDVLEAEIIEILIRPIMNYEAACKEAHCVPLLSIALLFGLSIEIIRSLLATYPEGAKIASDIRQRGVNECLPLHFAARNNASLDVLNTLIDAYPKGAATGNGDDSLPLHCLTHKASPENKVDVEKAKALLKPILDNEEACRNICRLSGKTPLDVAFEFNALSLLACVANKKCSSTVILKVLRRHPEQVRARHNDGNYPLHFVAANPNLNVAKVSTRGLCSRSIDHDEASGDAGSVEHDYSSVDSSGKATDDAEIEKYLICVLVEMYPEAAAAWNAESRFPINLAIESGKRWHEGVEAIADAAKHVILSRDEATDLYPFMLAAAVNNSCLDTVYCLLRRCPELKRYMFD